MFTSLTYNMKRFYTSVDHIRSEIDVGKPDVVFLQETWHLSNASEKLGTLHKVQISQGRERYKEE